MDPTPGGASSEESALVTVAVYREVPCDGRNERPHGRSFGLLAPSTLRIARDAGALSSAESLAVVLSSHLH
jgi:hypothetical protein